MVQALYFGMNMIGLSVCKSMQKTWTCEQWDYDMKLRISWEGKSILGFLLETYRYESPKFFYPRDWSSVDKETNIVVDDHFDQSC